MTTPPRELYTSYGSTLRKLAETERDHARAEQMRTLAAQLEVAFDQQGNLSQVALWQTAESTQRKIDGLHDLLSDTNTMISALAGAVGGLKEESRAAWEESGRRLKKLEHDMELSKQDRAELRERLQRIEDRPAILDADEVHKLVRLIYKHEAHLFPPGDGQ